MPATSVAPALSAGNTVAVKMPGQTALVANLVSQIIAEVTTLPRGVVNIFTESGDAGAPYLVASPDVQVISYTGSTRRVRRARTATRRLQPADLARVAPRVIRLISHPLGLS